MLKKKIDAVLAKSAEVVITTRGGTRVCAPLTDRDRYVTRDGWRGSSTLEPRGIADIRPAVGDEIEAARAGLADYATGKADAERKWALSRVRIGAVEGAYNVAKFFYFGSRGREDIGAFKAAWLAHVEKVNAAIEAAEATVAEAEKGAGSVAIEPSGGEG